MFCSKCGNELMEGATVCPKCGTKVVYEDADQQSMNIPVHNVKGQQTSEAVSNTQQGPANNTAKVNGGLRKAANIGRVLMWGCLLLLLLSSFVGLPINPAILVSIAAIGMILSLFGPKPLSLSTKIQAVVGVILLVVIIATSVRSSDGENDKYVQIVKEGTLEAYPQMTVGKAFDNYLDKPKWESGLSDNNERFVNVRGGILYYSKDAEIIVQFIVDEKSGAFQYNACEINGIPQNNLVVWELFETIYNDGSASTELDSQGGSNRPSDALLETSESLDQVGDEVFPYDTTAGFSESLEYYSKFSGFYEGSTGQSSLSISIYTSWEETSIGTVGMYIGDEYYYLGEIIAEPEKDVYLVEADTGEEVMLDVHSGYGAYLDYGITVIDLYMDGQYIDEYTMVEHYES